MSPLSTQQKGDIWECVENAVSSIVCASTSPDFDALFSKYLGVSPEYAQWLHVPKNYGSHPHLKVIVINFK